MRSQAELADLIAGILHREAAQFYFFDGELLSQYERWLDDPTQREERVRQAVERTVGTAALRLYKEIESVAQEAESDQRREISRERRNDQLAADQSAALLRIQELEGEIAQYDATIGELEEEQNRITREHGTLVEFVQEQGRLEQLAHRIDEANAALANAEAGLPKSSEMSIGCQ